MKQKRNWKQLTLMGICILLGNALLAFGVAAFIIPRGILSDGTTGIGIALNHIFPGFDTAVAILILNIVLLLIGFWVLGKKFFLTTIAGSILYPLFLAGFERIPNIGTLTDDPTLAAIAAGLIIGVGMGLTMRVGSSTGGMDIVALIAHRWFGVPISLMVNILGVVVIGVQAFWYPQRALLGFLVLILESILIEQVIIVGKAQVQIFVVSDKYEEIRESLLRSLNAGVTMTMIETGHLEKKQQGVLCVLHPRKLHEATELIRKIDPGAFLTVTKIREVHGRGFIEE